jgi:hypothetical protein
MVAVAQRISTGTANVTTEDPRYHRHTVEDMLWDREEGSPVIRYVACRVCEQEWSLTPNGWVPRKGTAAPKFVPRKKRKNAK